jgi:hypothetical protein
LSFNTSIIEKGRYKKHGSSLEEFMEGNLDWRSFGSITYNEMKEALMQASNMQTSEDEKQCQC